MLHRIALLAALAPVALVALAGLGSPATAGAAQGFVGLTQDSRLVRFQSDAPTGLSSPLRVTGLAPRERLVALAGAPGRVYAVGSSARLYLLNPRSARARRIGPPFPEGLRGTRFSLAVTGRNRVGRLLSDVGQSLDVDLATGATTDAPPLRRSSDGGQAFPAADYLDDGRLVGVDMARREVLTETDPGSAVLSVVSLQVERGADLGEPGGLDIAADGSAWLLASFGGERFRPQSIVLPLDRVAGTAGSRAFRPFLRRIVSFTSTGTVPDDTRPPRVRIVIPRRLSLRALRAGRLPFRVIASEGGQATAWVAIPGERSAGPALSTRDVPGPHRFRYFFLPAGERKRFAARVGRRVRVSIRVSDWAGNMVRRDRTVRLTR